MKSKKLVTFLSVLLCSSMIFSAGCGKEATLPTETGNKAGESLSYYVDAQFKSDYQEYLNAYEIEGEYVDGFYEGLVVVKNKDKDYMNNIVEKYIVYNVERNQIVLTFENKYEDIYFNNYDKFDNEYLQPSVKYVDIEEEGGISYIKITTRTNTKINEDLIEDYEDHNYEGYDGIDRYKGNGYATSYTYDYYDATGKKITSTNKNIEISEIGSANGITKIDFGKTSAAFKDDTFELVETWDNDKDSKRVLYDYTNEVFGYYLQAPYGRFGAMEVYSLEKEELVYRYVYTKYTGSYVLNNGDVLIQPIDYKLVGTDLDDPSCISINAETYIFNPTTVSISKVDTDYLFQGVVTGNELAKSEYKIYTDKVLNLGIVYKKSDVTNIFEEPEAKVVFFNSNLEITREVVALTPEQVAFTDLEDWESSIERLASGDYLVQIKSALTNVSSAIVRADGTLRTYVPNNATVLEKAIVTANGVYDFDFKLLKKFDSKDSFVGTIGNAILMRRYENDKYYYYVADEDDYTRMSYDPTEEEDKILHCTGNYFDEIRRLGDGFYIGVNYVEEEGYSKIYSCDLYYQDGRMLIDDCCEDYWEAEIRRFGDNFIFCNTYVGGNNFKVYKITNK